MTSALAAWWLLSALLGGLLDGLLGGESGDCRMADEEAVRTMRQIGKQWPLRSVKDPVSEYVQRIGKRLARVVDRGSREPWDFYVVRDAEPSAFAVGGGHFIFSDGLIALVRNESELAAVLAHEISHQSLGHFCRGTSTAAERIDRGTVVQHYDLQTEIDADREAVDLLFTAGYHPGALESVLNCLSQLPGTSGADLTKRAQALRRHTSSTFDAESAPSDAFAAIQGSVMQDLGGAVRQHCP
jgi:predicted Zn-dependent protease